MLTRSQTQLTRLILFMSRVREVITMALRTAVYITAIVLVWRLVDILNSMTRYLIHDRKWVS